MATVRTAPYFVLSRPLNPATAHTHRLITRWKIKYLNIGPPNECLDHQMIRTSLNFKIPIVRSIFILVNKPKPMKLRCHLKIFHSLITRETVISLAHPCQQLYQQEIMIHFFVTLYELQISLLPKATINRSAETTSMIPALVHSVTAVSQRSPRRS